MENYKIMQLHTILDFVLGFVSLQTVWAVITLILSVPVSNLIAASLFLLMVYVVIRETKQLLKVKS